MPRLTNKKTGAVYQVSEKELEEMRRSESFFLAFEVVEAAIPAEVRNLHQKKEILTKESKDKTAE